MIILSVKFSHFYSFTSVPMKRSSPMKPSLSFLHRVSLAMLTGAVLSVPSLSQTQTLAIGKSLYATHCQSCHNAPPRFIDGAQKAANNSNLIRASINRGLGGMDILSFLSDQDLKDVAAYIGNYQGVPTSASTNTERVLNWAEWKFQDILLPRSSSQPMGNFTVRQYTTPGLYVGTDGTSLYLYSPASGMSNLGALSTYVPQAQKDGF
jgi:mono/diheme cytochrome c family protein